MIRDMQGNPIPVGKTRKEASENFMTIETLPNWLSVDGVGNPNYRISGLDESYGFLEVKCSNNKHDETSLNLFPQGVNMDGVKEVILTFESLHFNDASVTVFLDLRNLNGNNGAYMVFKQSPTTVRGVKNGIDTMKDVQHYVVLERGEYKNKRNISLSLRSDGQVALFEDDQLSFLTQFSEDEIDLSGIVHPRLTIKNKGTGEKTFRTSKVSLAVYHN